MPLTPSDADERFDRTVERWFRDRLAMHPDVATYFGIHEHDHELSDGGRDEIEREAAFMRDTVTEMQRFGDGELSSERQLDRDLAIHQARLRLWEIEERRAWAGRSDAAEHIGDALFPLFTRDFAPLAERLESMAARLEQAPHYLEQSRERVTAPVKLWTEIDLQSTEMLPAFVDTIVAAAAAEHARATLVERLGRAADATKQALEQHAGWLRDVVMPSASAEWRTGADQFDELVMLRELNATSDEILAVGEQMLAESKAARDAVCAEIDPTLSPEEVADLVKDDHAATFPEALDEYRNAMDRARRFVVEHELATVPQGEELIVIETPSFLRHLMPFAAYFEPAKFDPVTLGTYIVTPPETPGMMREHNRASISNTGVHEAYPGHHLQLSAAVSNPSLVRLFSGAPEFAEGWAFYCEQMMKEQGFDATPRHRYVQYTDAIWRATRIILDVKLHRGEIGFADAVDRLQAETGFERPAALGEVKRYTNSPTYQLSYLYGRHMIESLKADVEARMGPAFSLKFFHDTLIYGGTMPVSYARRRFDFKLAADRMDT
jgi:uncharacterized protein (DUF885 family)